MVTKQLSATTKEKKWDGEERNSKKKLCGSWKAFRQIDLFFSPLLSFFFLSFSLLTCGRVQLHADPDTGGEVSPPHEGDDARGVAGANLHALAQRHPGGHVGGGGAQGTVQL